MIYHIYRVNTEDKMHVADMSGSNYFIMEPIIELLKKYVKEKSKIDNAYIELDRNKLDYNTTIINIYIARVDDRNTIKKWEKTLVKSLRAVTEYESADRCKFRFQIEKGDKHTEVNKKTLKKWK